MPKQTFYDINRLQKARLAATEYKLTAEEQAQAEGVSSVAVAVRSGPLLATAFHPELTDDVRWCVPHALASFS